MVVRHMASADIEQSSLIIQMERMVNLVDKLANLILGMAVGSFGRRQRAAGYGASVSKMLADAPAAAAHWKVSAPVTSVTMT